MTGTRTLLLAFAALALSVLLLRPVCNAAHPHADVSETASCCQNVGSADPAKPLDLAADGAAKPLVFAPVLAYVSTAPAFPAVSDARANAAPPPLLSFYARSSRILS